MTTTFKVGDKVRFKAKDQTYELNQYGAMGRDYTVSEVEPTFLRSQIVRFAGFKTGSFADRLELVPAPAVTKFKVGDRVGFNLDKYPYMKGDFYTITKVEGMKTYYSGGCISYHSDNDLILAEPEGKFIVILANASGALQPSNRPFIHPTKTAAETEAKRLASANTGKTFYVFEAGKGFKGTVSVAEV